MTEPDQSPPQTGPFELASQRLGALPIVDRFLGRVGLQALLERHLPAGDARVALQAATVIGVLVRNLCVAREPLYGLAEWAGRHDPALLGLGPGEAQLLNDDRAGRALDQLFDCDRGSLLTALMLGVIREFAVDCSQLHNDSTSISLHGDYTAADGRQRGAKPTVAAALGHSKDHRPELKQFVLELTVSADGADPRGAPTAGRQRHRRPDAHRHLGRSGRAGRPGGLPLRRRLQARHAREHGPHPLPSRTVSEHPAALAWRGLTDPRVGADARIRLHRGGAAAGQAQGRPRPGLLDCPGADPDIGGPSHRLGALQRQARLRRRGPQSTHRARDARPGSRPGKARQPTLQDQDARRRHDALAQTGAARWIAHDIQESIQEGFRQEKRGRPGRDTRYRKTEKTVFTLTFKIDEQKVAYDAATDGCFPLVSNDRDLTDPELLGAYRYQPNLEKRHHQLKTVLAAAPVTLKSPSRIEGLACCEFIALLCQCLIERELRAAMTRHNVTELALYHEGRATRAPTAGRVFDLYADTTRHHLTNHDGEIVQLFEPQLDDLQRQVLDLLGVPADAYLTPTT